jgi:hypothetical protein
MEFGFSAFKGLSGIEIGGSLYVLVKYVCTYVPLSSAVQCCNAQRSRRACLRLHEGPSQAKLHRFAPCRQARHERSRKLHSRTTSTGPTGIRSCWRCTSPLTRCNACSSGVYSGQTNALTWPIEQTSSATGCGRCHLPSRGKRVRECAIVASSQGGKPRVGYGVALLYSAGFSI